MTNEQIPEFGRFFLPGPTEVRREVMEAMLSPMAGHRTLEMEALMERIQPGLQRAFGTRRPVYVAPASGTGVMEMGIRNVAQRRVLSLVNGAFSERFAQIAEMCGLEVDRVAVEWGENHTTAQLATALEAGDYDTVTVCHSETSTGVLNPVAELTEFVHDHGAMVCVDAVSSMAGAPFHTDAWGVDFVATGSQKAFALPPGLGFAVASERVLERAAANPSRGFYFDVLSFEKNLAKSQTPNTPAMSLLYAAAVQMEALVDEGVERRWARHQAMAERTWAWVDERRRDGLELYVLAPAGYRSPTVTCITLPDPITGSRVCAEMRARGFVIAPGYGDVRDDMVRIGHMGDHTLAELETVLETLQEVLEETRVLHG